MVYLIGSLRCPRVPEVAAELRHAGFEVYDDWWCVGPKADDYWQSYSVARGQCYAAALKSWAAQHTFRNDKQHLDECSAAVLLAPAGKSAHLELGYVIGRGVPGYILLDTEPERWDVMAAFADGVFYTTEELTKALIRRVGQGG